MKKKNITYTAKRLFMTQPALSERIKRLEKEFNCNLIIRQPRGIALLRKANNYITICKRLTKPTKL